MCVCLISLKFMLCCCYTRPYTTTTTTVKLQTTRMRKQKIVPGYACSKPIYSFVQSDRTYDYESESRSILRRRILLIITLFNEISFTLETPYWSTFARVSIRTVTYCPRTFTGVDIIRTIGLTYITWPLTPATDAMVTALKHRIKT